MSNRFFEIRPSSIQGLGGFATRPIRKGTRIIEYTGERISQAEADARYDDGRSPHPLVLLFTVDENIVIDAGVDGNEARYINHSCDPNCEAVIEDGHVYIEARKNIPTGRELTYDYSLTREGNDDTEMEARFACHCGAKNCRGTMLEPRKKEQGQNEK